MEKISETMLAQAELMKRRAELKNAHTARVPKKPVQQHLRTMQGTTNIPHNIFEIMISDPDLNKRELKVLMLVVRLTFGLHQPTCHLRTRDFSVTKIGETNAQKIITELIKKEWLKRHTSQTGFIYYEIHPKRHENKLRDGNLSHLICTQMHEIGIWRKNAT